MTLIKRFKPHVGGSRPSIGVADPTANASVHVHPKRGSSAASVGYVNFTILLVTIAKNIILG
ncbi:MAG TPA: hypothetical protein VI837_04445 [Blastocatellia bacterium]|nr:hypothetical protein [Blastocatellia bacterium]